MADDVDIWIDILIVTRLTKVPNSHHTSTKKADNRWEAGKRARLGVNQKMSFASGKAEAFIFPVNASVPFNGSTSLGDDLS